MSNTPSSSKALPSPGSATASPHPSSRAGRARWGSSTPFSRPRSTVLGPMIISATVGAVLAFIFLNLTGSRRSRPAAGALELDFSGFDLGGDSFFGTFYMNTRSNLSYYKTILRLAEQYAPDAKSVIDVGAPWPYVTAFKWIPAKVMLNNRYPEGLAGTSRHGLSIVEADFYEYQPPQKFDLVLCNQVMEHVPDPASFARKLLDTGNVVIASVPYLWPSKEAFGHLQHMIDADQLLKWFGRTDYREFGVIKEVDRMCGDKCRRVYVVFAPRIAPKDRTCDRKCREKRARWAAEAAAEAAAVGEAAAGEAHEPGGDLVLEEEEQDD